MLWSLFWTLFLDFLYSSGSTMLFDGVDVVDVVDALFSAGKFVFEVISTALPSAHAACRRPVSFLRMMQHWIMAPGFQPKERPAN